MQGSIWEDVKISGKTITKIHQFFYCGFVYMCIFRIFQATCATSGDGLYEGLDWLSNQLKNANR